MNSEGKIRKRWRDMQTFERSGVPFSDAEREWFDDVGVLLRRLDAERESLDLTMAYVETDGREGLRAW